MRSPQENMLAVLDALDVEPRTIRALAERTGLSLATVHRIVARLIEWGALERVPGGVQPGLRLFELGQLVPARGNLREIALPFMGDLYAATHEVVSLAVLDGTDTVWLEQLSGRLAPPVPSRVGGRLPAHVTAAGKALLAFAPHTVETLYARGLDRHGPGTITDPERLREELAGVRERGIAINREESRRGVVGVAAPVISDGTVVAALALAVARRSRSSPEAMTPAVRTAALSLGRALSR
ncbi:MAG TPA: IclR family transcriptional regulator [Solirubrobacter sp.]